MKKIALWGAGGELNRLFKFMDPSLDIECLIDSDIAKQGQVFTEKEIICKSANAIGKDWEVIIAIASVSVRNEVEAFLDAEGIKHCTIYDAIEQYRIKLERKFDENNDCSSEKISAPGKLVKYIDCIVPVGICNLKCPYCYLGNQKNKIKKDHRYPRTSYIVKALSPKRLGGTSLINFCGDGETLLCDEIIPVIKGLIDEGHFVSVVTNGIPSSAIEKIAGLNTNLRHLFVKFSFHYSELKRLNLLKVFSDNVNKIRQAGCSISIEITPSDELIPMIDEVKVFSLANFGALPHISVARDETVRTFKILSELSEENYKKTWSVFNSPMFEFKFAEVGLKRFHNCMAGVWSLQLNIETGDLYKCTHNPWIDNIYQDINRPIKLEPVLDKCCLPYCFNCHSYLALGSIKGIVTPTYYEIRDRETVDGGHWVSEEMKQIFIQRLWENNECIKK